MDLHLDLEFSDLAGNPLVARLAYQGGQWMVRHKESGNSKAFGADGIWVRILALPLICCVRLWENDCSEMGMPVPVPALMR